MHRKAQKCVEWINGNDGVIPGPNTSKRWTKLIFDYRKKLAKGKLAECTVAFLDDNAPLWRCTLSARWMEKAKLVVSWAREHENLPPVETTPKVGQFLKSIRVREEQGALHDLVSTYLDINIPFWRTPKVARAMLNAKRLVNFARNYGCYPSSKSLDDEERSLSAWLQYVRSHADKEDFESVIEYLNRHEPSWKRV